MAHVNIKSAVECSSLAPIHQRPQSNLILKLKLHSFSDVVCTQSVMINSFFN